MKQNIDRGGRIARGISGLLCITLAGWMLWSGWPSHETVRWGVGGLFLLLGLFQIFEALTGWCVMRACGFKTPM